LRAIQCIAFAKRFPHSPAVKREFNVIIEKDSAGYYVATVPELRGCHTQAKSLDTLMKRAREAIELCLEVEDSSENSPDFVGVQRIAV
jgi:predicted RNase H-like HicB family nuclease